MIRKLHVFLSHSSKDKQFAKRLNSDLRSRSIDTWIDEDNIPFGASIPKEIQKGIDRTDVLFVLLSENAINSRWVESEWQSKFFQQIDTGRIVVIPILLEKCVIPTFLSDKRYVDFTTNAEYESNLSLLLDFLEKIKFEKYGSGHITLVEGTKIVEYTKDIIDDLKNEEISLPMIQNIKIIDTLKKIPRSGKLLRLGHFMHKVKVRTVYDHMLSLAHLADCILPYINHDINVQEYEDVARCIAFHELNEVVLGGYSDIYKFKLLAQGSCKSLRRRASKKYITWRAGENSK